MPADTSESLFLICLAVATCLLGEWLFFTKLRSALRTGECSCQHGTFGRADSPVLYWSGVVILAAWVVLLPVMLICGVIAAFIQQRG